MQSKRFGVSSPGTRLVLLTALTLAGFALRLARLDFQSLWKDEVVGVVNSLQSLPAITLWVAGNEPHPPLHYYILHVWMLAAGSTELAARFPSVLFGTASIPAAYMLLRNVTNPTRSLVGAAVMTLSAFHIYYSQETRMHVEACFFVIVAAWALLAALKREGARRWMAYTLASIAALFTFYYTAVVLLALNLPLLFGRQRRSRTWWLANAVAAVSIGPWLLLVARTTRRFANEPRPSGSPVDLTALPRAIQAYTFGITDQATLSMIPAGVLTIVLLLCAWRLMRRGLAIDQQLVLWGFLPPVTVYFSTLVAVGAADSTPRLVLICLPAWIAILARGWRAEWRVPAPVGAVVVLGLALPTVASLANMYGNPDGRDNYRAMFQLLRQRGMPDEALIYDSPEQGPALAYYYQQPNLPAFGLPTSPSREQTDARLVQLAGQYHGVWALLYGEPQPWVEEWLEAHLLSVSNQWIGPYARLEHFVAAPLPPGQELDGGLKLSAALGPFELRGLRLPDTAGPSPLTFEALWQLQAPAGADYTRSFQLFDPSGRRVAQDDRPPLDGALPTSRWMTGARYEEPVSLALSSPLAPGVYTIKAAIYPAGKLEQAQQTDAARLSVTDAAGSSSRQVELLAVRS